MSSQDLSWHLKNSFNFSQASHVKEMNAQWQGMRRKPEIRWQNSQDGPFFSAEDPDNRPYTGPTRPYISKESVGLQPRSSESPRTNLTESHPPQLSNEVSAIQRDADYVSRSPYSVKSRHILPFVVERSIASSAPPSKEQPESGDTDSDSSSDHDPDTPTITPRAPVKAGERKTYHGRSTYHLNRQTSADFVPSSQQGEKDSNPPAPRAASVQKSTRDVGEIVPGTPDTSIDASRPTHPSASKSSNGRSPVALGNINIYKNARGPPEVLRIRRLSGLQQRPYYP